MKQPDEDYCEVCGRCLRYPDEMQHGICRRCSRDGVRAEHASEEEELETKEIE